MTQNKQSGFAVVELLVAAVIVGCFAVGGYFAAKSKDIDHPLEQASEAVLKTKGIEVDFSAKKKANIQVDIDKGQTQVQIKTDDDRVD